MKQTITQAQVDAILAVMRDVFDVEIDGMFRPAYPGRGMYGKTCVGFVVAPATVVALGAAFAITLSGMRDNEDIDERELELMYVLATEAHVDSMAFDVIIYFPRVTLAAADTEKNDK